MNIHRRQCRYIATFNNFPCDSGWQTGLHFSPLEETDETVSIER